MMVEHEEERVSCALATNYLDAGRRSSDARDPRLRPGAHQQGGHRRLLQDGAQIGRAALSVRVACDRGLPSQRATTERGKHFRLTRPDQLAPDPALNFDAVIEPHG